MKTQAYLILVVLLAIFTIEPNTFAQDNTQLNLPEGAKFRFGKGRIEDLAYSPDGARLVVASSIGVWLYDAKTGKELNLISGHTSAVNSVAFSPDGHTFVTGSSDRTVRLWDTYTGARILTLLGHSSGVECVAFSPNGQTIASGSWDDTVRLWDANTGKHLQTLTEHTSNVSNVVFSPGGTILATGGSIDTAVHLWNVRNVHAVTHIRTLWHTSYVNSIAFSPDGRTIATGQANDRNVHLWRTSDGKNIGSFIGLTSSATNVAFSPEGNTIASGGQNEFVLWDTYTGKIIRTLPDAGYIRSVSFSPDGNNVAIGSADGTIRLWEINTGKHIRSLKGHTRKGFYSWTESVAFSPDGRTIASGGWDNTIKVWDADTGRLNNTFIGHTDKVNSVVFSPDGKTIASGSSDRSIRLWNANTGKHIRSLKRHTRGVISLAFSPDGKTIASGSWDDGTIQLWDASTGRPIRTLSVRHKWSVYSLAFSPDGKTIASANPRQVDLWDANTGKHIHTFIGHTNDVNSVVFSPDGKTIASGSEDGTIRLWEANTDTLLRTFTGTSNVNSVVFSPDGKTIASANADGTIRLWNANTGKHIHTFRGPNSVLSVVFSPDGRTIASGSANGTVSLWNASTDASIRILTGHTGSGYSVAFSPDGETVARINGKEVHLWDAYTGTLSRKFSHAGSTGIVAFSPNGQIIATGGWGKADLWDAHTGTLLRTLNLHALRKYPGDVNTIAFSPDGRTIAIGTELGDPLGPGADDPSVLLWNTDTGALLRMLSHTGDVNTIAFSPDGKTIVTGGAGNQFAPTDDDYIVRLWDTNTGKLLHALKGHTNRVIGVAFSPDGNTIASGSWAIGRVSGNWDGTLRLWDANTGTHLRTLDHVNSVDSVAFSPDRQTLAFGSGNFVYLYDANAYTLLRTLSGHKWSVYSLAFSPDGSTLASGSIDGTALLWELRPAATSNATVHFSVTSMQSPAPGEQLILPLNITGGENVAGYQARISYDTSALRYVSSANGDYLPDDTFYVPPTAEGNTVMLTATALSGESNGDGTLATLTFEVIASKASTLILSNVLLTNSAGASFRPRVKAGHIVALYFLSEDINEDGVVNIQDISLVASNIGETGSNAADVNNDGVVDIADLTLVAAAIENAAAAPSKWSFALKTAFTRAKVEQWLHQARQANLTGVEFQRGILMLEQFLVLLTPKETALLPNYPNPFNPETWIPYQLATPADVSISIHTASGHLVRTLALGHQPMGIYESRSRAAYWDGRNTQGEPVVSGVYFYTLTAGDYSATRKMLIIE